MYIFQKILVRSEIISESKGFNYYCLIQVLKRQRLFRKSVVFIPSFQIALTVYCRVKMLQIPLEMFYIGG